MKQKDIALLILVAFLSVVISYFVSNLLFGSPGSHRTEAEVVEPISSSLTQPDTRYFNDKAYDPTKQITIGNSENPTPFNSSQR